MITLTLPMPPSINHYFARNGNRTYIPDSVKVYRSRVMGIVCDERPTKLKGRLSLYVAIYPGSKRRMDLDNRIKGLQDALTLAGVWEDDEQIDVLTVVRGDVIKGGQVKIEIRELQANEGVAA